MAATKPGVNLKRARQREAPEVQRQRIVQEAIRLIGTLGYHGFKIQELATRCGLTNGGVLYHFGSKPGLLVAVLEERDRREAQIIPAQYKIQRKPAGKDHYTLAEALAVFTAIMRRSEAEPELIRLMTVLRSEALHANHPAHDYFVQREALVANAFRDVVAGLVVDADFSARAIYALMLGFEQQYLASNGSFDLVHECVRAIEHVLAGNSSR